MRISYIVDPTRTRSQNAYYIDQIYRHIKYSIKKNKAEAEKDAEIAKKVWDFCIAIDSQDTIPSDKWRQIFNGLRPLLLDISSTEKEEEGYKEKKIKKYIGKLHKEFAKEREGITKELSTENKGLSEENKQLIAMISIMLPTASAEQKQTLLEKYPEIVVSVFPHLIVDPSGSESSSSSISASSSSANSSSSSNISHSSMSGSDFSFLPPPPPPLPPFLASTESKKKPASVSLEEIDSIPSKVGKTNEGTDVKTTSSHSVIPKFS